MPTYYESWTRTCNEVGLTFPISRFYDLAGMSVPHIFELLIKEQLPETTTITPLYCEERKKYHHEQIMKEEEEKEDYQSHTSPPPPSRNPPIEVVFDIIRKYHTKIPIGIASSGWKDHIISNLTKHNLLQFFSTIVTVEDEEVKNGKPHPDMYVIAAEKLGVDVKDCVGFEDADLGMESIKSAGYMYACDVRLFYDYPRNVEKRMMVEKGYENGGEEKEIVVEEGKEQNLESNTEENQLDIDIQNTIAFDGHEEKTEAEDDHEDDVTEGSEEQGDDHEEFEQEDDQETEEIIEEKVEQAYSTSDENDINEEINPNSLAVNEAFEQKEIQEQSTPTADSEEDKEEETATIDCNQNTDDGADDNETEINDVIDEIDSIDNGNDIDNEEVNFEAETLNMNEDKESLIEVDQSDTNEDSIKQLPSNDNDNFEKARELAIQAMEKDKEEFFGEELPLSQKEILQSILLAEDAAMSGQTEFSTKDKIHYLDRVHVPSLDEEKDDYDQQLSARENRVHAIGKWFNNKFRSNTNEQELKRQYSNNSCGNSTGSLSNSQASSFL